VKVYIHSHNRGNQGKRTLSAKTNKTPSVYRQSFPAVASGMSRRYHITPQIRPWGTVCVNRGKVQRAERSSEFPEPERPTSGDWLPPLWRFNRVCSAECSGIEIARSALSALELSVRNLPPRALPGPRSATFPRRGRTSG